MTTEEQLIEGIIARHDRDEGMLIPMMQDLQAECGYLPQGHLRLLAKGLGVPLSRIYGAATFYGSFRLTPRGEHTITLCMGTVCYLRGADRIGEAIQQEFGVEPGGTSPDRKFTLTPVNCVGACALAPVMIVDGQYFGMLNRDSAIGILRKIAAGEKVVGIEKPKPGKVKKAVSRSRPSPESRTPAPPAAQCCESAAVASPGLGFDHARCDPPAAEALPRESPAAVGTRDGAMLPARPKRGAKPEREVKARAKNSRRGKK